jgi:hypothetical protein
VADQVLTIEFEGVSEAEASRYANELRDDLLDSAPDLHIRRQAIDPNSQDFGSTLILLLAAPAVVTVAKGIKVWLERRNVASLTIKTEKGEIIVKNLTSEKAAILTELMSTRF